MAAHPALGRRTVLAGSAAVAGLSVLPRATAAAADRPWTVPALRSWTPASGVFVLTSTVRVALTTQADASALAPTAQLFADDLAVLLGTAVPVHVGPASTGDVVLRLGPDAELGAEGYALAVGSRITVSAPTVNGAFYGTRSVLQMLRQNRTLPGGAARDWPRYAERGLMVDIGRKAYSLDWLLDRVTEMGELKLNHLHLHFTDDDGWRIESELTPGVHSDGALTHDQVRTLLAHADRHGVHVVPEIDLPGHLAAGLRNYPQLQLKNVYGKAAPGRLDYTNPQARAWARGLVAEYLDLFPGPSFHLGGDEFMPAAEMLVHPQLQKYAKATYGAGANAKDGIIGFLNDLNVLVRSRGKRARVWNDGLAGIKAVPLNAAVDVEWWTDVSPLGDLVGIPAPQKLLDAGHRVINCGYLPTYYVARSVPPNADPAATYTGWSVNRFHGAVYANDKIGTPWHTVAAGAPGLLGSKQHLWNDDPAAATEAQDAAAIAPRLAVMAQKTWDSPPLTTSYAEFTTICGTVS